MSSLTLGKLKEGFEKLDPNKVLEIGISEPFSWRGSYDEVAFSIIKNVTVKECLDNIEKAFTETFYGYKGGEYKYFDKTPVNFESDSGRYSGGSYAEYVIDEYFYEESSSVESKLANCIFNQ